MKNNCNEIYYKKIVIIGRPNVGKSTILNQLIEKKISIVTPKKNTTSNIIFGTSIDKNMYFIFLDTPGIEKKNNIHIRTYWQAIYQSNIIIMVTENIIWNKHDEFIYKTVQKTKKPILLLLNKIDKIKNKNIFLSYIQFLSNKFKYIHSIIPISAKKKKDIQVIKNIIKNKYCDIKNILDKNKLPNNSIKFTISEIIREKIILNLNQELPYCCKIKIIKFIFLKKQNKYFIQAMILVNRKNHKKIFIGEKAQKIKKYSMQSRQDIQVFLKKNVDLFLEVHHDAK
ncbi:GTPase Era [Buchnera aphidicola (Thelaxes suberi)]|uniref:GTPase Era n=1 Tax=Buchnera aphidicola TaxID=9 RepID=UPI0034640787